MKLTHPFVLSISCLTVAAACVGSASTKGHQGHATHSPVASAHATEADDEEEDDDDADDVDVALSALPSAVKTTALGAVAGIVLEKAEKETEDGPVVYSIEGKANGKSYCIEVAEDGSLIGVEDDDED